eukprot:TRINITY_DN726_c0_g1_i9.p1 TRINITY_DN726_c0_g1~~TRINITY_DN726_c0_g1_i9.p1  ORF type:complete len:737 (+),score=138.30 TRINITY_DN726_c0_g1_i9:248-2212(+)
MDHLNLEAILTSTPREVQFDDDDANVDVNGDSILVNGDVLTTIKSSVEIDDSHDVPTTTATVDKSSETIIITTAESTTTTTESTTATTESTTSTTESTTSTTESTTSTTTESTSTTTESTTTTTESTTPTTESTTTTKESTTTTTQSTTTESTTTQAQTFSTSTPITTQQTTTPSEYSSLSRASISSSNRSTDSSISRSNTENTTQNAHVLVASNATFSSFIENDKSANEEVMVILPVTWSSPKAKDTTPSTSSPIIISTLISTDVEYRTESSIVFKSSERQRGDDSYEASVTKSPVPSTTMMAYETITSIKVDSSEEAIISFSQSVSEVRQETASSPTTTTRDTTTIRTTTPQSSTTTSSIEMAPKIISVTQTSTEGSILPELIQERVTTTESTETSTESRDKDALLDVELGLFEHTEEGPTVLGVAIGRDEPSPTSLTPTTIAPSATTLVETEDIITTTIPSTTTSTVESTTTAPVTTTVATTTAAATTTTTITTTTTTVTTTITTTTTTTTTTESTTTTTESTTTTTESTTTTTTESTTTPTLSPETTTETTTSRRPRFVSRRDRIRKKLQAQIKGEDAQVSLISLINANSKRTLSPNSSLKKSLFDKPSPDSSFVPKEEPEDKEIDLKSAVNRRNQLFRKRLNKDRPSFG